MLGLKECPRVQMKEKIERLSAELEERELAISRLEERLETKQVEALEDNISKLGTQLSSRERDLLTLCNKMDYVRRYVKRLRDDEDLSVKVTNTLYKYKSNCNLM
jgi:predicted RNase H-like nuclease (RuvC/YqgF family)